MIWKEKPQKQGPQYNFKNITWEINNSLPDKYGNIYTPGEKLI